jgi:hypothetical protein
MESTMPNMQALNAQLAQATATHPALQGWQEPTAQYALPAKEALQVLKKHFGHALPDDVANYLHLNTIPWSCCRGCFRALSAAELLTTQPAGPVLPLAWANGATGIGVNLATRKGETGHIVWFSDKGPALEHQPIAMPYATWEAFAQHLVAQAMAEAFSYDSRGLFMGIHVVLG